MPISRRGILKSVTGLSLYASFARAMPASARTQSLKEQFLFDGVYLNAAYTHPPCLAAVQAGEAYLRGRWNDTHRIGPHDNARDQAVALFARLIHAEPSEIAVVPSTMEGENHVCAALGIGKGRGVVTDGLHYDASLAMYGELERRGAPVVVVAPENNRINLAHLEKQLTPQTRLVSVSLVSSTNGFVHDLKALCQVAHAHGALVYADIIQAAGAMPIDVKQSGVDFCCSGCYKFLMGDFGAAFLYVRPDRLQQLQRTQFGWRQMINEHQHRSPFDAPGPAIGSWELRSDTAGYFEVSTPAWASLAIATASLQYIHAMGVDTIAAHRKPLLAYLRQGMLKRNFVPMTPEDAEGPVACYAYRGAKEKFKTSLDKYRINVSLYENYMRISPSIFNEMEDIECLLHAISAA
jgi:selenocysteine lyase/cysteine desulfurase